MGNFRGINPLLADVWATFLGNSSVLVGWCVAGYWETNTYTNTPSRDYVVVSPACVHCQPHHNLTSCPPIRPHLYTAKSQSPPPTLPLWKHQAVWGHPARINCIIDHLLYIHTGNIVLLSHWWGAPHSWRQIGYQESNWSSVIWWRWQNIPIIHTRPEHSPAASVLQSGHWDLQLTWTCKVSLQTRCM